MEMYCLLCRQHDRVFNIHVKSGKCSPRDDMLELFGEKVLGFLIDDNVVCNTCMNILYNFAKLKRRMYRVISGNSPYHSKGVKSEYVQKCKYMKFNQALDGILTNLSVTEESDFVGSWGDEDPDFSPDSVNRVMSSESSPELGDSTENLIQVTHAISYNEFTRQDYMGKRSRPYCDTPDADKEIEQVLHNRSRRRRRKGHNWTRRKHSQQSQSRCRTSSTISRRTRRRRLSESTNVDLGLTRAHSSLSSYFHRTPLSFQCSSRSQSRLSGTCDLPNGLQYNNGILMNKRTRSVTRQEESLSTIMADRENARFKCVSCPDELFIDLEELTGHRIDVHREMALFWCYECSLRYVTNEDLVKHKRLKHSDLLTNCPCCSLQTRNLNELQDHLQEHILHSVPCMYCDKCFLNKKQCDDHVKLNHRGRKKRIRQMRPHTILDRVDKNELVVDDDECDSLESPHSFKNKVFNVRIMQYTSD